MQKMLLAASLAALFVAPVFGQMPQKTEIFDEKEAKTAPLDGIVARRETAEKMVLRHQPLRENDVIWEQKVWRVIDVREKQNQPFADPRAPFFDLLKTEIERGAITAFSTESDRFDRAFSSEEVAQLLVETDTLPVFDVETGLETVQIVRNDIDGADIRRFRVKEVWFFDKNTSTVGVRILGIAPLRSVFDSETGDFRYEKPLFWVYWPDCREAMARYRVFQPRNDAAPMTWDDAIEMRRFASTVVKGSNVRDERLEDIFSGRDRLLEGEKIAAEIFSFEHDLWSW